MFNSKRIQFLEEQMQVVMKAVVGLQLLALKLDDKQSSKAKVGRPKAPHGLKKDGTPRRKPGPRKHRNPLV